MHRSCVPRQVSHRLEQVGDVGVRHTGLDHDMHGDVAQRVSDSPRVELG